MKIGMKGTWALLTKWRCWFWDRARATRAMAREARQNALIHSLWWLEVTDLDENRCQGRWRQRRQNVVVGFGITRAQRAQLRAKRARMHLFAVYGG